MAQQDFTLENDFVCVQIVPVRNGWPMIDKLGWSLMVVWKSFQNDRILRTLHSNSLKDNHWSQYETIDRRQQMFCRKKILKHLSISQNDWPSVEHYRIVRKIILNHSKTFWKVNHSGKKIFTQPLVVKQICQSSVNRPRKGTNGYSSELRWPIILGNRQMFDNFFLTEHLLSSVNRYVVGSMVMFLGGNSIGYLAA